MSSNWVELQPGESIVPDGGEKLWRNINPGWIDAGAISKQAFLPFPKDDYQLSCARSSKVDAAEHHREFTEDFGFASVGVWSVTAKDVSEAELRSIDDSEAGYGQAKKPAGHAYIDYRSCESGNARKRSARHLREAAHKEHPLEEG